MTLLLSSGAGVNIRNSNNKTAFDVAIDYGRLDVGLQDRINLASSDTASQGFFPSVARPSLGHGSDATMPDELRRSLYVASDAGHLEAVRSLLDSGADVNERNKTHHTPLLYASMRGRVEDAKLLIEYGADVNF